MPMPWNATLPTRASVRTLVSLRAAAGAADGDDGVDAVVGQRGFERDVARMTATPLSASIALAISVAAPR